jgi:hypothetical protein
MHVIPCAHKTVTKICLLLATYDSNLSQRQNDCLFTVHITGSERKSEVEEQPGRHLPMVIS